MRISEIIINNYRAFYNEKGEENTRYRISLGAGKNLLVYGENGSGKSSLYKGIKELFRSSVEDDCTVIQNVFSKGLELDEQPYVEVLFTGDGHPDERLRFSKDPHQMTTRDNELLTSVVRSRSFMTYRDLLHVHFVSDPEVNLFDFLFGKDGLLSEMPTPVSSRPETNLKMGELRHTVETNRDEINTSDFVKGVNQILSDLNNPLNCLLSYFDESVTVTFSALTEEDIVKGAPIVKAEVTYFGIELSKETEKYHQFLNEARLSALAICIFLAAHLSVPDSPYQILFLDDIFTGLDTSNRIPLLRILTDETINGTEADTFINHQIILTTYDRQWYELARNHLGEGKWSFQEMYIDRHTKGFDHPSILPGEGDFEKALFYFNRKEYPACANYQRKICENLIKKFLPDHKKYDALPNGDIKPVDKLSTLIDRFEGYLVENGLDFTPYKGLKICLRAFMNPLSHDDGDSPVYRKELELGFSLLEKLQELRSTEVLKQGAIISTRQVHRESGAEYIYEFEVQTAVRLISTETEKKIGRIMVRPLRMTSIKDNKATQLGYEPESLEKGLKSVSDRLKIPDALDPLKDCTWKNSEKDEPLSSILDS